MLRHCLAATALALLMSAPAQAACNFQNTVPVKSLTAAFDAWKAVTTAMAECGNVHRNLTKPSGPSSPQPLPPIPRFIISGAWPTAR